MKQYHLHNVTGIEFVELTDLFNKLKEEGQVEPTAKVNILFDESLPEKRILSVEYDANSVTFYNFI